jgi:type III pantothenate kinase
MNLIAVDIGNSIIHIGLFSKSGLIVQRIDTLPLKTLEEYSSIFQDLLAENFMGKNATGVIISSVVSGHNEVLRETLKKLLSVEPLIVSYKIKTGLTFCIPNPEGLGSDRIANAVAAYERYKCPVAVIDFGTATAVSVVGVDADYVGGAIMPGVRLMNESLAKGTSKLSEVPLTPPDSALGLDTVQCIQSGLFYGAAGAVERLLSEIEEEIGFELKVVLTGGYGYMISKFFKRNYELIPDLTIEGLKLLYTRNMDV